jgi:hypothetical protein
VRGTVYGGGASSPWTAHVVGITATQVTIKVFSGTTAVASAVTVYREVSL